SVSPTGQVFGKLGIKQTLERAAELIGADGELGEGEAVGGACGWGASFGVPSGAGVEVNGDGTGTILTRGAENGRGGGRGLPLLVAEELGMQPGDFSILYQDTDAGPWDQGSSGSQTTFNNGRAVVEAAREVRAKLLDLASDTLEVAREDLELAGGEVRIVGAPDRSVTIADLAGEGTAILGKGSGPVPENPPTEPGEGWLRRLGME